MKQLWTRTVVALKVADANSRLVADEAIRGNLARIRWMVLIVAPLNLLGAAVFWWWAAADSTEQRAWKHLSGVSHLAMACWLGLCALAAHHLLGSSPGSRAAVAVQLVTPLSGLLFAGAFAVIDQLVTPNISPFLLGSVFVSSAFLIRPGAAVALYAVVYALFFWALEWTQPDPVQLLTNRLNGLFAAVLGMVLALFLWHKNTVHLLLQRELQSRNAALVRQREELAWLAKRDGLTGLFNRSEFLQLAEVELLRAQRNGTDTSAIMVDLDRFKAVNDLHGHPAGDKVLKHAADWLRGGVRATDTVARIGGEEFVVLLPQTPQGAAIALAEKLLAVLQTSPAPITREQTLAFTASLGVGTLPAGHGGSVAALYAAADHALYEAKRKGRNRVEKTEPDASLTPSDFQRMRRT